MSRMRFSMKEQDWFVESSRAVNSGLIAALPNADRPLTVWHPTRVFEYPWIVHVAPPIGNVLDIGSNPQFGCALLGMGVKRLVAHHTYLDIDALGTFSTDGKGAISIKSCFSKNRDHAQMVLGMLDTLDFVKEEFFDTIYCISVIEHLPPCEVGNLIDGIWRLLKPGGTAAITCDWFINFGVNDGIEGKLLNHDLSPYLAKNGMVPQSVELLPWQDKNIANSWSDGDCGITYWDGQMLGVYGFTVTKPK